LTGCRKQINRVQATLMYLCCFHQQKSQSAVGSSSRMLDSSW
jgi:hypothetical protein